MRAMAIAAAVWLAMAAGVMAADPDRAAERERLFNALAASQNQAEANAIASDIWRMWLTPPNEEISALMDEATRLALLGDFEVALGIWDQIVAAAPDWSEGWNQRATLHYRLYNYEKSLADIAETLKREPKHFGALSGRAQIELFQGRVDEAVETLREAVAIHPWIPGHELIDKGPAEVEL